jgi:hypothetical protein
MISYSIAGMVDCRDGRLPGWSIAGMDVFEAGVARAFNARVMPAAQ